METYLTEAEAKEIVEGKASAATIEKIKPLTQTQYIPKSRLDEVLKDKDAIKVEVTTLTAKAVETENKFKIDLDKQIAELTRVKTESESKDKIKMELETQLTAKQKQLEEVTKTANDYSEFKKVQIEEAKKILGDKWQDEFASFDIPKLTKVVTDMTGKQLATIIVPPKGKQLGDVPVTGKEMIAKGLTQLNKV